MTPTPIYMAPTPSQARKDDSNAIHQVVLRLARHLPAFGFEVVEDPKAAALVVGHAGQTNGDNACDVAICHGLYPTALHPVPWHFAANEHVIAAVRGARQVSVPSRWVAELFERDMHFSPHVVPWAIDPEDWTPGEGTESAAYVLWNKTRADAICSPVPMNQLAERALDVSFISTFGNPGRNVTLTGRKTWQAMRPLIRGAGVYLATSKETFGIGTLEAMACGVPVLGFRHGATAEIVVHLETGYLVEPGDVDGLLAGLRYCQEHRARLGANARAVALTYTWDRTAEQLAHVFELALQPHDGPKVSVVIPAHNYARYLGEALRSVAEQHVDLPGGLEVIVVDDASTDQPGAVVDEAYPAATLIQGTYGGPAAARNAGIQRARGQYIVCLDADDRLGSPHFVQTLAAALDAAPTLGVAFTGLRVISPDGAPGGVGKWPRGFDFEAQIRAQNQVPTCCMFRREAWRRAGGYRSRYEPAEDAEFWLRLGALGYDMRQVSPEPWFEYRLHPQSLSASIRTGKQPAPDWTSDKAWIAGGPAYEQRPFAALGRPKAAKQASWPVRNYDQPEVSFIVPVGPGHTAIVREALDSIEAQTVQAWEALVVDDTPEGDVAAALWGYPFARVLRAGGLGAGAARNLGVAAARAPLLAFLDADDLLHMRFLERALETYRETGRYVYTDYAALALDGGQFVHQTPDYDQAELLRRLSIHAVTTLVPKAWVEAVGGFDERLASWEDADLFLRLAVKGYCGVRIPQPLFAYRYRTGARREQGVQIKSALIEQLNAKYKGVTLMACCGQDSKTTKKKSAAASPAAAGAPLAKVNAKAVATGQPADSPGHAAAMSAPEASTAAQPAAEPDLVRVRYEGPVGPHEVRGLATRQRYGRRGKGDVFYVYPADQRHSPQLFVIVEGL